MKIIGIIPSRYKSSRFPGKPLVDIKGKSMVQRVYEQCNASQLDEVIVATDDQRIYNHVISWGGRVMMTSPTHESGTDRCAEIAQQIVGDIFINIQGDEPTIDPSSINQLIALMKQAETSIGTLVKSINDTKELFNPNVVKVVLSNRQKALYFSRASIPFNRDIEQDQWLTQNSYFKHIGMYGYQRAALLEIAKLPKGHLETIESLEQLRWLEAGYQIGVAETFHDSVGIDTPEQLSQLIANMS